MKKFPVQFTVDAISLAGPSLPIQESSSSSFGPATAAFAAR